jgi:hypothetical protein
VHLPHENGQVAAVPGAVVTCHHVKGAWHVSCVRFTRRLDPLRRQLHTLELISGRVAVLAPDQVPRATGAAASRQHKLV